MEGFTIEQLIELSGENAPRLYRQPLASGDSGAHTWVVRIVRGGAAEDLTGCTASLNVRRDGDSDEATLRKRATIAGNRVSCELPRGVYELGGKLTAVMVVEDSAGRVVTAAVLLLRGKQYITDHIADPDGTLPSVPELLQRVAAMEGTVRQLKNEIGVQNYTYNGRDLSVIFGTLSALHAAVSAGDFSKIRVGDYWPIMLNGIIKDYASGETKALNNAVFKLEVAPQVYVNYGDTAVPNHLLMCSRDLIPWTLMYRSENTTWYDDTQTNPWLGSHLHHTLNASDGILPLVEAIFGSYMYAGPNGKGMRFMLETKAKDAANATGWGWGNRGKLFLPTECEVWGKDVWSEHCWGGGAAVQWPMFIGSLKHIVKGLGNGGSRSNWWCQSSLAGSADSLTLVDGAGLPGGNSAANAWVSAPLCFLFV